MTVASVSTPVPSIDEMESGRDLCGLQRHGMALIWTRLASLALRLGGSVGPALALASCSNLQSSGNLSPRLPAPVVLYCTELVSSFDGPIPYKDLFSKDTILIDIEKKHMEIARTVAPANQFHTLDLSSGFKPNPVTVQGSATTPGPITTTVTVDRSTGAFSIYDLLPGHLPDGQPNYGECGCQIVVRYPVGPIARFSQNRASSR
jgi:hypothetical protein